MTQPSTKKAGYDRFIRSVQRNLNYWHTKIEGKDDLALRAQRGNFMLVCRAIRVALRDDDTVVGAAQLAITAVRYAEQCHNWSEWSLVLRETDARANDSVARILQSQLGMFLRLEHKFAPAMDVYMQAIAAAEAANDQNAHTHATVGLITCYLDQKDWKSAEQFLTDRLSKAVAESEDNRLAARYANNVGNLNLHYKGQFSTARDHFVEALSNYRRLQDDQNCVRVLHNLGLRFK